MTRFVLALSGFAFLALGSGPALAASSTLDFSALDYTNATTRANTQLGHGDIISQYQGSGPEKGFADQQFTLTNGVKVGVSASVKSNGDERAVIFDSKNFTSDEDTDLEVRNISGDGTSARATRTYSSHLSYRYENTGGIDDPANNPGEVGNILILQENTSGCGSSGCSAPDDEASKPAGFFYFEFSQDVIVESIDFVDIEEGEEAMVWFFDEDNLAADEETLDKIEDHLSDIGNHLDDGDINMMPIMGYTYTAYGTKYGGDSEGDTRTADSTGASTSNATYDTKWSQMVFGPTSGTRGMLIKLGGSGGVSDIRLRTLADGGCTINCGGGGTDVPEPASFLLLGTGLAAMAVADRRRRRRRTGDKSSTATQD